MKRYTCLQSQSPIQHHSSDWRHNHCCNDYCTVFRCDGTGNRRFITLRATGVKISEVTIYCTVCRCRGTCENRYIAVRTTGVNISNVTITVLCYV